METYTVKNGKLHRIPEWPELRYFAERLIWWFSGVVVGLIWKGLQG